MDGDTLTAAFFEWSDNACIDFEVMFDEASTGHLRLLVNSQAVILDFAECQVTVRSSKSPLPRWKEWACVYMSDNACDIRTGEANLVAVISTLMDKLGEFLEYQEDEEDEEDEEENEEEDEEEEVDYREDIMDQEREAMVMAAKRGEITLKPSGHLGAYHDHFIFREAREAMLLLEFTIAAQPGLKYALGISEYPSIGIIRLELDLSFLDISDQAMCMLGLHFNSPLSVTVSVSDIHLTQTSRIEAWTPQLLGFLQFEVTQEGRADSYGCIEYIKGRLHIFKQEIYHRLKSDGAIPPIIKLTRENSCDKPKSKTKVAQAKLSQLCAMGFNTHEAEEALRATGNDIEAAVDMLSSGEVTSIVGSASLIATDNFFYTMLFYLRDRLENCTNYCYICYARHKGDSSRMRPCNKEICEFRFEEISGFSVYPEIMANVNLIHLDLSFAAVSMASVRAQTIFEPFPSFMLKSQQIRGKAGFLSKPTDTRGSKYEATMDSNKDLEAVNEAFRVLPSPHAIKECCSDEASLIELIVANGGSMVSYKLLKYIIATNRLNLIKLEGADKVKTLDPSFLQYLVTNHSAEAEASFNAEKASSGSFFAFHGSSPENWYSIVRNGIRNLSNTHLMTAGAAYGSGVYAASFMSTSLGYSATRGITGTVWSQSLITGANYFTMAIIEVINKSYDKGNGIYVINNDRHIMLRYILLIPTASASNTGVEAKALGLDAHLESIQDYLRRSERQTKQARIDQAVRRARDKERLAKAAEEQIFQRQAEKAARAEEEKLNPEMESKLKAMELAFTGAGSATATKRIFSEYKYLVKSKECRGIDVHFLQDSCYIWQVVVDVQNFELSSDLKADFVAYANKHSRNQHLEFEVRFDSSFPFNPPFVRVVRPRFAFHTGHVTIGGSICMQSLTPSGWIPVRTVESVFIEIMFNLSEGGARLDLTSPDIEYTLRDAQEAFNRVARQHNWL
jgi:ubiquitin-protein ligase